MIATYMAETAKRQCKNVAGLASRHTKSHIVRCCLNSGHETVIIENFEIFNVEYNKNNTYRRTISEALLMKQYCPSLQVQDKSVPLELFN